MINYEYDWPAELNNLLDIWKERKKGITKELNRMGLPMTPTESIKYEQAVLTLGQCIEELEKLTQR